MKKSKLHIQAERKYEFLELQNKTLYEAIKDSALTYPKRKAFYFKGKYYSYTFLLKRVNQYVYLMFLKVYIYFTEQTK